MAGRRFAVYFAWDRTRENGVDLGILENRYPALFEFRRAIWPAYEWAANSKDFAQDISGFLDHVILFDFKHFFEVIAQATGHPVAMVQRADDSSNLREITNNFLKDIDTLIIVSLDHVRHCMEPTASEVAAIRDFLKKRKDGCLIICPHHGVGAAEGITSREIEHRHHGDKLIPAQQLIGGFALSLIEQLKFPIERQYGLRPANLDDLPASLLIHCDLDKLNILEGVSTFNLHPHLPHFHVTDAQNRSVHVLAKQPIDLKAPSHPFVEAGNNYFNSLIWISPNPESEQAANVFICDATIWSAAFSGVKSLEVFWQNLSKM